MPEDLGSSPPGELPPGSDSQRNSPIEDLINTTEAWGRTPIDQETPWEDFEALEPQPTPHQLSPQLLGTAIWMTDHEVGTREPSINSGPRPNRIHVARMFERFQPPSNLESIREANEFGTFWSPDDSTWPNQNPNPRSNPRLNPHSNPRLNSQGNQYFNPRISPHSNLRSNSQANPHFNLRISPRSNLRSNLRSNPYSNSVSNSGSNQHSNPRSNSRSNSHSNSRSNSHSNSRSNPDSNSPPNPHSNPNSRFHRFLNPDKER